ncbi:MAG: bifunctional folylpolyglutamate synthase/dihydrofolate synthase [Firmicutes bacterium]|nr:bifunctional folylpolyglutamate synthase/dihydrofolate synthase [Bacillota bacterium]
MQQEKAYNKALEWIHGLGRFGIKPGLERVTAMLELLGNPHHGIRFVHVAGTNGKGSTAAMLASILRAAGYTVGLYTSPYLLSFTNRMSVNNTDIEHGELVRLVDRIKPIVEQLQNDPELGHPTEFEVVTVLALAFFAASGVDLVVMEVGLGGRLDATNIVTPLISIITNISLEHTDVLGNTIEEIAFEKAGIIKQGKPLITAAEDQRALCVFIKRCQDLDCLYYRVYPPREATEQPIDQRPVSIIKQITEDGQFFNYHGFNQEHCDLFIALRGKYQLLNAATALAAVELLENYGFTVSRAAILKGLAETSWPGRLELLQKEPLVILDGAHNPAAMEKLAEAVPLYFKYKRLVLVIGMLADKDTAAMLKFILPLSDLVVFTRPLLPRAADPQTIADFALNHFKLVKDYYVIKDHQEALDKAFELAEPEDAILVTGSLYTVSDIRAYYLINVESEQV